MRDIVCPRCGSPISFRRVFSPGNKPFCARCGWNLERAEAAIAGKNSVVKLIPLGIAMIALLGAFAAVQTKSPASPAFLLFPLIFAAVLLLPLWGYYSTRKAIGAAKFSVNPDLGKSQPPMDPALQQLQALSRPRRVGFRIGRNAIVVLVTVGLMLLTGLGAFLLASTRAPRIAPHPVSTFPIFLPALFMLVVFPVVILLPILRDKRNLPLLRDGELAFGRVTAQQTIQQGKASYSRIEYEFKTSSGQLIQNSSRDLTNSVFEDMTVPVFYDPMDPSKNVTPCATYLQISTNSLGT